jgi:hypothetical protein
MYKSLRPQACSCSTILVFFFRGQAPQSLFFVLFLLSSRFSSLVRVLLILALIPPCSLVEMIMKSFIALLILALASSVIAAPIAPDR